MTKFHLFDTTRPQDGAAISAQEVRELLQAAATGSAGVAQPGGHAILIGDLRLTTVSVASKYKLSLTINGVASVIDVRPAPTSSTVTPTDIVAAINAGFSSLGTVAYAYSTESYDASSFIALVAPKPASGVASITVTELLDGTDASANILGIQYRGEGMPYTVTGIMPAYGTPWLQTSNGDDDSIRMYMGSPARATGLFDLGDGTGTVNLSVLTSMRIKITTAATSYATQTINIQGATPSATTPEEIAAKINAAFLLVPGWPSVTHGPAVVVTRNGSGKYLQIVSGPSDSPSTGSEAIVELSGLDIGGSFGVNFLVDDAITIVMGLPRGIGHRLFSRVPHVFRGSDFNSNYIRGVGSRSGAGIGPWGPALETAYDIPPTGAADGEKRTDKVTGIDWIYKQGQFLLQGSGWSRAIPGYEYPISYDKFNEQYKLKTTTDTFVPQPLCRGGWDAALPRTQYTQIDAGNTFAGRIGDAVALVDGRDFFWKDGTYPDSRNFSDTWAIWDNFKNAGQIDLRRTRDGLNWIVNDSNTPAISANNPQRLRPVAGSMAATEALDSAFTSPIRAYADGTGITRQLDVSLGTSPTTVNFTIPGVSAATPILAKSFSLRIASGGATDISLTPTGSPAILAAGAIRVYDEGAGSPASTLNGGAGTTGTINYNTGAVSITFQALAATVAAPFIRAVYSYCHTGLQVVSVDVRKNPAYENRGGGTPAEAGVIYGASALGASGVDTGSGFAVVVRDDGTGSVVSYTGGTGTALSHFLLDPPLDTNWRTLRVLYQVEAGSPSNNAVHSIFWNGSNKSCDWITKDYSTPEAGLTSSQTNGGVEVDRNTNKLIHSLVYQVTGNPNETGLYTGIYAKGAPAGGGYTEKVVNLRNFQSHGGHKTNLTNTVPALPPVSAIRLRDTINAVEVLHNGEAVSGSNNEIITDCTAATPMQINLKYDLANAESKVDTASGGRRLDIALNLKTALATKDGRHLSATSYIPGLVGQIGLPVSSGNTATLQNLFGTYAVWDLSSVLVDDTISGTGNASYRSATGVNYSGLPFLFGDCSDGSVQGVALNTPVVAGPGGDGLPHRYWSPNIPGTPAVATSQTTFRWTNILRSDTINFDTYLPADGANGINWVYVVQRAELVTETSKYLNDNATNSGVSGGYWLVPSSSTWPNAAYRRGGAYLNPCVTKIVRDVTAPAPFARFQVTISYYGPVRPAGIHLVIAAYRKGTS